MATARRKATTPPPLPVSQPVLQAKQVAATLAQAEAAATFTPPPAPVESSSEEDDDEWEWQLAMARARAAAEQAEDAAKQAAQDADRKEADRKAAAATAAAAAGRIAAAATAAAAAPVRAPQPMRAPDGWVRPDATPMPPRTPQQAVAIPVRASRAGGSESGPTKMGVPAPARPEPREEVTKVRTAPSPPATRTGPIARPVGPIEPPSPMAPVVRSTTGPRSPYVPASRAQPPAPAPARPVGEDTVRTTAVREATVPVGEDTTRTTAVGDQTTRTHAAPPPPKKAASDEPPTIQRPMSTRTVIPVPELPTLDQTQPALRLEPVVRSRAIAQPPIPAESRSAPRRFPRGTDQHAPSQAAASPASPARGLGARPANDDGPLPRASKRLG